MNEAKPDPNLLNEVARIIDPRAWVGSTYATVDMIEAREAALSKASQVLVLVERNSAQSLPCGAEVEPLSPASEPSGQWRKRPVVVDAYRVRDLASAHSASDPAKWNAQPEWVRQARLGGRIVVTPSTVLIGTLEGDMRAQRDDWIIRGVQGEIYPCKPDIFAATYEPAEPQPVVDAEATREWLKRRNEALRTGA